MKPAPPILGNWVQLIGKDGRRYAVSTLTRPRAHRWADELLQLHNLIPRVQWSREDLMSTESASQTAYLGKWSLSLVARYEDRPVGILIAYVRDYDAIHPCRSIYLHRIAVARDHQRNWLGLQLVNLALAAYFESMPWILTVTVQTNEDPTNHGVLDFYKRLGFVPCYRVNYPDKVDRLLEFDRAFAPLQRNTLRGFPYREVPAIDNLQAPFQTNPFLGTGSRLAPKLYFGTGSKEKFGQYRYIARCFGIQLERSSLTRLTSEPQIEGYGELAERGAVETPLKLMSRFTATKGSYPYMVEDTMLFLEHFNDHYAKEPILPGPDVKRWWRALGPSGVIRLLHGSQRRGARYVCQIGVTLGPGRYEYFRSELNGTVATSVRMSPLAVSSFPFSNATFFHSIFIPSGTEQTLAEMDPNDFVLVDYRRACFSRAVPVLQESVSEVSPQLGLPLGD